MCRVRLGYVIHYVLENGDLAEGRRDLLGFLDIIILCSFCSNIDYRCKLVS